MKPARLFLWQDRFIWVSHSFKGQMTRRYATNVILAITDTPFRLRLPHRPILLCHAALCASRAPRCVDATDTPFLSFNLDPGSADARRLEALMKGQTVMWLDRSRFDRADSDFHALLQEPVDARRAHNAAGQIVHALLGATASSPPLDPRIESVLAHLRTQGASDINLREMSELSGLSASRLMHLFSQQVGLPMSQFLLWGKMRHATSLMQSGKTLTEIAQSCGFSDSSHLTRTFKTFYGIKPSVLSNSNYVQLVVF